MFNFKSLVTFAAVAVFSVSAAPAPAPAAGEAVVDATLSVAQGALETRADLALIKICKNHYYNDCITIGIYDGDCGFMSTEWNDVISSYEVLNQSEFFCRFFEHTRCPTNNGAWTDVQADNTLHDGGGWWADRISSIQCWRRVSPNPGGCGAPFC